MGSTGVLMLIGILAGSPQVQVSPQVAGSSEDRLYGRVTTASGAVHEGYIRWDRNEGSWADVLNGSKEMPIENLEDAERLTSWRGRDRSRSVEFLGIRISWDDDGEDDWPRSAESGIRFGHIRRLTVLDDDAALLELKSGERVELFGGSTDLGTDLRQLSVEDLDGGVIELEWRDLDWVDFLQSPPRTQASARRLYGTLEDRWGNAYTGYISWDLDEILMSDVLDGEEDGREREVPFWQIAAIERFGSSGAHVTLLGGEEIVLRGTDDVTDDNRGIQISDPGLGEVRVRWDEFEAVRFHDADRHASYADFDGGHRIRGTVVTEDGEELTGNIRWDNDEMWSWELLDGEYRDVIYDVEFGNIERIEKRSRRSAYVVLKDGRTFELENSNDVDQNNKGIFVELDDGSLVAVDWYLFREAVFH